MQFSIIIVLILRAFTLLCNHRRRPSAELPRLKQKLCIAWNSSPASRRPRGPALLPVSVNWAALGTSCEWNYTVFVLL